MWWLEFLEFALFFTCLYFAYLGCKQDINAERRPCLSNSNLKRDKVTNQNNTSQDNENNDTSLEPDLPSYSEVVHS